MAETGKGVATLIGLALLALACGGGSQIEETAANLEVPGPYLGQMPPGNEPVLFAPGIVTTSTGEWSMAVTPDGLEIFFGLAAEDTTHILHTFATDDGLWTDPSVASFSGEFSDFDLTMSPDGNRLYFFSEEGEESSNAWVIDKTESGWGEPRILSLNQSDVAGRHINEVHEARSGNLYLSGPLESVPGGRGIVRSRFIDGQYQPYDSLGPEVNSPHSDRFPNHSPTVDPDERFVIFASTRPGGHTRQDLYISYRQPDDSWGPAINLGSKINGLGSSASWPQLSPDGKYLFFVSSIEPYRDFGEKHYSYEELSIIQEGVHNGWSNIYWVDTSFVDTLRPAENN